MSSDVNLVRITNRLKKLNEIGIALSKEKDINRLLELILEEAKSFTNADAGTLYMMVDDDTRLQYKIMRTDSLNFKLGGTAEPVPESIYPVKLFNPKTGEPNHNNVSAHSAITGETINITDAYTADGFDFSGTKGFDEKHNYRSQSFLTVPMKNHENKVIGILQLINAQDISSKEIIPFSSETQEDVESLASQAALALTNRILVDDLKQLLESFIMTIADAIDRKSPYTGDHCRNVPKLTLMLADKVVEVKEGPYKDFVMDEDEKYELETASWLHDCGKVTTPVHIVDKATKLEAIFDRIELIRTRFEVLKRDIEIDFLKSKFQLEKEEKSQSIVQLELETSDKLQSLQDDLDFIEKCNVGSEFMSDEFLKRIKLITTHYNWVEKGEKKSLIDENELENLSIRRGTLTAKDRKKINDHIVATIEMLNNLPFPEQLKNVPLYAGGHHEHIDGSGYPNGKKGNEISIQERMMAIADVFEALTAPSRPYKKGYKLSKALDIISKMAGKDLDKDLVEIFIKTGVYKEYSRQYMNLSQVDEIDEEQLLNRLTNNE
ncbi:MAG: GAF domain-containing protein [Candidatus Marinimicrobia bacterium]|nr:GAF domain-containing protein [Candidatus Neomarinimicrobiota bacterium]MBL7023263.1 GAF domain-containing protein [Candidatus Neomarinimicrobiota bacterium]MBL7108857.1 GAF domain-containing protein [Candidatus Neomarinimicrobiota bacterium]